MKDYKQVIHPLPPVWNSESRVLILGTMPSPKSREDEFYYAHPRNRFWKIMSELFCAELNNKEEKTAFLLKNHIALWDVLYSCEIIGADDSSIKNPVPNDIAGLISKTQISTVFTTGSKAFRLYRDFCQAGAGTEAFPLPSTSPANARMSDKDLIEKYSVILRFI